MVARFEVIMKTKIRNMALWVMTSCNRLRGYLRFEGTYCLHLQTTWIAIMGGSDNSSSESSGKHTYYHHIHLYFLLLLLLLWRFGSFSGHGLPNRLPLPKLQFRFRDKPNFYKVGLWAPRPTPKLEDQGVSFCLGHHLWPFRYGSPCYATAGIAVRVIWPHKPRHCVKLRIQ
jgi:hypothetical protein